MIPTSMLFSMALKIQATDGVVMAVFDEPLTPSMYGELLTILAGPSTRFEIEAVIKGLSEDWQRRATPDFELLPHEQN